MPIYEYRCLECGHRFGYFVGVIANLGDPQCHRCGSKNLKKLISRVSRQRSEDEIFESLAEPSMFSDVDENDPRSVLRWAKKMSRVMGEEFRADFDEVLAEMEESGELEGKGEGGEGEEGGGRAWQDML